MRLPLVAALAALCPLAAGEASLIDLAAAKPSLTEQATAQAGAGGIALTFQMPAKRSGWTTRSWAVFDLPKAGLAGDALAVAIATIQTRAEVALDVAVMEADGTWWETPRAVGLHRAESRAVLPYRLFVPADRIMPGVPPPGIWGDENGRLDPEQITRIALGVVSGNVFGDVQCTLTALGTAAAPAASSAGAGGIAVTGKAIDINGTTMLPGGVFGGFNLKQIQVGEKSLSRIERYRMSAERGISSTVRPTSDGRPYLACLADRGAASPRLSDANWKASYAGRGKKDGDIAAAAGKPVFVEFWNEPYLNWSNKWRRSYDPKFFNEAEAKEGGEVKLKSDGTPMPLLRWTQDYDAPPWNWNSRENWRRGRDASGRMLSALFVPESWNVKKSAWDPRTHPPLTVKDGEEYEVTLPASADGKTPEKKLKLTAFTPWYVYDTTQFSYWTNRGISMAHDEPMVEYGKAFAAAAGTHARFIAGWGFRPSEDEWAAMDDLFIPTIDAAKDFLHGVVEHDYGGDPYKGAANHEVITAYGMTKHGKWLYGFNTETGSQADPQAVGASKENPDPKLVAAANLAKYRWIGAKIIHAVDYTPDKTRVFLHFGMGGGFFTDEGEGVALDQLRALRGALVESSSADPDVLVAASIDGTDPDNLRPADLGEGRELVIAVVNTSESAKGLPLAIAAPTGTQFAAGAQELRVETSPEGLIKVVAKPLAAAPTSAALAPREMAVWRLPITGTPDLKPTAFRRQFFADAVLAHVRPGKDVAATVAVPAAERANARRAWLQLTVEHLAIGEGTAMVNGTAVPLPPAVTLHNNPRIIRVPIDVKLVQDRNALTFACAADHPGYRLASASIVVER